MKKITTDHYNNKVLIITDQYSSSKELIKDIIREKYYNHIDYIKINIANVELLASDSLVINWKEYHPGAIITHHSIAGLPAQIIEEE